MITVANTYAGVDVSKNSLDIYILATKQHFKIANSQDGMQKLLEQLAQYATVQVACEATGGYEKLLVKTLEKASYDVWIIDPRRVKAFIVASGCKSKTDKIDAQKIAEFASKNIQGYVSVKKSANEEILKSLVDRKADLVKFLAIEKTRLKQPSHELSVDSIKVFIALLQKEIKKIDKRIIDCIKNDSILDNKMKILESIPGIGAATAALLVTHLPELGKLNKKEISSLVGVCPFIYESGNYKGQRFIRGGRKIPRNALYMCALTSIKYHLPLRQFYDHLRMQNKIFKVAIVAVMHKLIMIANSLLKKGELCRA